MFKLFWVGKEDDDILEVDNELDIDVSESLEEEDLEEEIGQVALDVLESDREIVIVAPIAGVELEHIDISLQKTILTIKWEREKPMEYTEWNVTIRNSECYFGKFVRNIILPENLELNKIKAYMENNMLIITVPKLKFDSQSIKIDKFES